MTDRAALIARLHKVRDNIFFSDNYAGQGADQEEHEDMQTVLDAIAALEADMTQEPAAPGIYDVQSKAQREWWEVRNGLMTMVRFRSLKEIMAGLGIEQFKPFGDYPDYTTAPTFPTGTAETAAELKSLLTAQHAEAMELLQSKLALLMRENRRLSDELKRLEDK